MRRLFTILGFVALSASISWGQLAPANEMGVAMGHLHLNVKDAQAAKAFWVALGGTAANQLSANAGREVVKFPGVLIAIVKRDSSGGTEGSVIDHVGFHVPNVQNSVAKWKAAGLNVQPGTNGRKDQAWVFTAENLKIEILEDPSMTVPIAMHHIHFFVPEAVMPEIRDYYVKNYGAKPGKRLEFLTATLPGVELTFAKAPSLGAPTKGRALDHIGFEVKDLEAFCKKMQASGVKFDREYRKQENFGGITVLTDPWGATMELTEGERQY